MLQIDFKTTSLRETLLTFLWRQWSALGVSGTVRSQSNTVIDPEALLLLSLEQARHDPRLFDEVLDWAILNESRINIQRLTSLIELHPWKGIEVLPAVAAMIAEKSRIPRWKKIMARGSDRSSAPEPLFFSPDGTPQPVVTSPDATFLRYGWVRPVFRARGLITPTVPGRPETLIFTLRAFFGIQARAEIFAWLLCRESGRPGDIANATGFKKRTVEITLGDMAGSGQVIATRRGRDKYYHIAREKWPALLPSGGTPPQWVDRAPLFALISNVFAVLDRAQSSPIIRALELKRAFTNATSALTSAGLISSFTAAGVSSSPDVARLLQEDLQRILSEDAE